MRNWLRKWLGIVDTQPSPLTRAALLAILASELEPPIDHNAAALDQVIAKAKDVP